MSNDGDKNTLAGLGEAGGYLGDGLTAQLHTIEKIAEKGSAETKALP